MNARRFAEHLKGGGECLVIYKEGGGAAVDYIKSERGKRYAIIYIPSGCKNIKKDFEGSKLASLDFKKTDAYI